MRSAKKYISMLKSWALPMWAFPHRHTTIWHKILSSALLTTSTLYIPALDSNTKTSKSSISLRLLRVLWAWLSHIPKRAMLKNHWWPMVQTCASVVSYIYIYIYLFIYLFIYIMYVYIYIVCVYIYVYIYTYIYIYMYMCY